ncbi:MAG: 30S ribosomal protein S4 [Candidatus Staskawiczbacteria bacterium RIFCSPHIGHO2_12_FULL_38_11]|uniref:Small ribosomal subunit protein uS4 n=1 Tax=Candidatus Staskawiczbacteria bacterium RIFCSPHIGHO2_12_FULL_38_11 TaxID=1802209 RepID=A0A1G2I7H9_9BACT|nr:MAG: 30S ribosomal protein S4 [Candidatus Staskawiczbacteria bacterium RIFCSPHIGHO2_12_FULL_38_11]
MANQPNTTLPPKTSFSPDSAFDKKALGGQQGGKKKRSKTASEYKKSLQEKQTLKRLYGLSEKQFKRYVKESLNKMQKVENISEELVKTLEKRLDNVIFRLGFASTRAHSRQLVNHSYFLVNGKAVNIPSFQVKRGDVVIVKETKKKKGAFKDLAPELKKMEPHKWLELNKEKFEGKVVSDPSLAEVNPPVEISLIFEFYSR